MPVWRSGGRPHPVLYIQTDWPAATRGSRRSDRCAGGHPRRRRFISRSDISPFNRRNSSDLPPLITPAGRQYIGPAPRSAGRRRPDRLRQSPIAGSRQSAREHWLVGEIDRILIGGDDLAALPQIGDVAGKVGTLWIVTAAPAGLPRKLAPPTAASASSCSKKWNSVTGLPARPAVIRVAIFCNSLAVSWIRSTCD